MENNEVPYIHSNDVHNLKAPEIIVPQLIKMFRPASVIDVGCGIGTFLHIFEQYEVFEILGVDGSWVNIDQLYISKDKFIEADLQKPFVASKNYDLVLCLEVAEHLSPDAADTIVDSLTNAGKIIIFSAAVPNQGGFNHINEQPHSYWQNKFLKQDYVYYDIFRTRFWDNEQINWWYKQNMFLVAHKSIDFIKEIDCEKVKGDVLTYIHPELMALHDNLCELKIKSLNESFDKLRTSKSLFNKIKRVLR